AVNMVSVQSGAQILFVDREGTLPNRVVTLTAKPRNVEVALGLLCKAAQCYWWKDADGIFMISAQAQKGAEPTALKPAQAALPPAAMAHEEVVDTIRLSFSHPS